MWYTVRPMRRKVYLASPLGFSLESRPYLDKVKRRLTALRCAVLDPWDVSWEPEIMRAAETRAYASRVRAFGILADRIGKRNEDDIRKADVVLGVLDGVEVDSGTAAELGYGSALGRRCYGLRTDRRETGDFAGLAMNLQVLWFIKSSGGRLFRSIEDISF